VKIQQQNYHPHEEEKMKKDQSCLPKNSLNFKPKIGKVSLEMNFFKQSPSFATNNHIHMMNSQRYHILCRPTLQDLRSLRFTTQLFRKGMTTREFTNFYKGDTKEVRASQLMMSSLGEESLCSDSALTPSVSSLPQPLLPSLSLPLDSSSSFSVVSSFHLLKMIPELRRFLPRLTS
jgi:hypothetical protein